MLRARMELDKARAKAAEARMKPKAPLAMKMSAAMTLDPAQAASVLATYRQPPQAAYVRPIVAVDPAVSSVLLQSGVMR